MCALLSLQPMPTYANPRPPGPRAQATQNAKPRRVSLGTVTRVVGGCRPMLFLSRPAVAPCPPERMLSVADDGTCCASAAKLAWHGRPIDASPRPGAWMNTASLCLARRAGSLPLCVVWPRHCVWLDVHAHCHCLWCGRITVFG